MNPAPYNPYAAPTASFIKQAPSTCSRDGKILIVPEGHALPDRCVKCNAPGAYDKPRKFAWHHPAWYLLIPVAIIVYAVVATFVQKRARLAIALCDSHRARRRNFHLTAWACLALGLALLFLAATGEGDGDLALMTGALGGLCMLLAVIVGMSGSRLLWPARITSDETHLKGCGSAFLDSLPSR